MILKKDMKRISPFLWKVDKGYRDDMNVPAMIFATENMLDDVLKDRSIEQLINVSTLPGIQKAAIVMPDVHEGYGFPIGGVAATLWPSGVISPGGIGYDINCGVRLLKADCEFSKIRRHIELLGAAIYSNVPSGVGKSGDIVLSSKKLDNVLKHGSKWMVENGYGYEEDIERTESSGCLKNADPDAVFEKAKKRGHDQLGTMGAGNHFVEIDIVDEIFDSEIANAYGLFKGQAVVLIHTGSRGLGHQVATDYIKIMMSSMKKYGIEVPDRELACAPFDSNEGQQYFNAMAAAANFAWANRQAITHKVRQAWESVLGKDSRLSMLYDVAHNIAKIEEHEIEGQKRKVIVHRKGATRAFGPGHPDITSQYREVGQPVIIPGSMGTASYVLAGTNVSMQMSFGSSCHGAGRQMSRSEAKRRRQGSDVLMELENRGIHVQSGSLRGLAEEAPGAYKDVDDVVNVVSMAGIAKKVARLKPMMVIKG
ncbi:tRNA-splicing ligase RtcB [Peptoclostridium litorale DSM 5388]|uniref:tRNA-splicing ligase RtcB n=1 Tax=Peptoclostridium litorale DSM 5388 TaxID=1121324 RepID=A0A069REC4_PEPLI|nr:RtcB family protein [Peptoclostridium litorale]KDR93959.1 tRNA-splicing ligase RtcB [Peptoclostridium litorale DSM 5388]KDR95386.1 tRNA-splicing ligase RtcB [Peptoclostridium litorale DSM 5388]SIN89345.1 tRNA-splicing ligase RtcB [Peptoclostridium litorale DSM 5388]